MGLLKSPSTQKYVFLLVPPVECLSFTEQIDICAVFETRRLFHIHLLKVESFFELIENPISKSGPTHRIHDITNSLEANFVLVFSFLVGKNHIRHKLLFKQECFVYSAS